MFHRVADAMRRHALTAACSAELSGICDRVLHNAGLLQRLGGTNDCECGADLQ